MSRKERRTKPTKLEKVNKEKKEKVKASAKKPKEVSIFTILFVVVLIAALVGVYFGTRYLVLTLKYKKYTDKMVTYSFNELYDNKKATSTQKVTNAEMIKVILGSIQNNTDISKLYYLSDSSASETKNWYEYSKYLGVNSFVSENKLNENATIMDSVILAVKTLESLAGVQLEQSKLEMKEDKLSLFTEDEQVLIAKAVTLGVISNKNSSLSEKEILKGELNKLVISIVEEYATIHYGSITTNEKGETVRTDVSIVTEKEKLPENYKEYPYIVDSVDKEAYEYEYQVLTVPQFESPKETHKKMGYLYGQTNDLIVRYFNKILNVNYETITTANFVESIANDVTYVLTEEDVKQYVDYVKENKIKLEGSATPLLPIMYNNGEQYVVRTKITFKVLNSATQYNLLFGDEDSSIKYNGEEITMYVDLPTGTTLNANSLLVYVTCLAKHISNTNTTVIVEK